MCFPDVQLILWLCHIVKQKFQYQGAAKAPPLDLEVGKAHRADKVLRISSSPDETGVFHCLRKTIALPCARRSAAMVRAVLAQIFAADILVAVLPVPAAVPSSTRCTETPPCPSDAASGCPAVQTTCSAGNPAPHSGIPPVPSRLRSCSKIRQDLCCGGDKIKLQGSAFSGSPAAGPNGR